MEGNATNTDYQLLDRQATLGFTCNLLDDLLEILLCRTSEKKVSRMGFLPRYLTLQTANGLAQVGHQYSTVLAGIHQISLRSTQPSV